MQFRKNIAPHIIPDIAATLFLTFVIPITFWFEIFIVLPEFHAIGSKFYIFTFIAGVYLLLNVKANMLAVMLCDTSIKGKILNPPEDESKKELWRLCTVCETLAPPRSWHCNTCKTCILKRDHHCIFTGCCIGHSNHRYFLMLLLFLFIGTAYASVYNTIFIWWVHADTYANWVTAVKMIFPLMMFVIEVTSGNSYLLLYELNLIGMGISLLLLIYHGNIVLDGAVAHERKNPLYNLGWKQNLKMVLGERWYLVWISPFIESKLPHDGIHWEDIKLDSTKNR